MNHRNHCGTPCYQITKMIQVVLMYGGRAKYPITPYKYTCRQSTFEMVWLAGVNRDKNNISHDKDPKHNDDLFQDLKTRVDSLPTSAIALASFATGAVTAVFVTTFHVRYGRRLKNGEWITPDFLGRNSWIKGVVTS